MFVVAAAWRERPVELSRLRGRAEPSPPVGGPGGRGPPAAGMESLQQLEHLCERLYNAQDPSGRSHAESMLRVFATNPEYISQCKTILDASESPYAQLMAASSLTQLVTDAGAGVDAQVRLDIRSYLLNYLASKGPRLVDFSATALVTLLCRLTKLGWHEQETYREIVTETTQFLNQRGASHVYLGLKILNQLVTEMNQPNSTGRSLTLHRKTAVSFRDSCLGAIFQTAVSGLKRINAEAQQVNGGADGGTEAERARVKEQTISLALRCLSFDFVGTSLDESTEDLGTIQVPSSWRPLFENLETMQLFFDFYAGTEPMMSSMALECLVKFASIRRSLFATEAERLKFLGTLMSGTLDILVKQTGLTHHSNYHEFCRLIGRFKQNYQLGEIVGIDCYHDWINSVAEFTYRSLQSWQWTAGSVYYLLGLWSRLVSSAPYLKSDQPSELETFVPKIVEVYVSSRLESVPAVLNMTVSEDPLDNQEHLQDQLDNLPYLFRFRYEETVEYLKSIMDPLVQQYTAVSAAPAVVPDAKVMRDQVLAVEGQLTWIVSIIGAIIRGRLSSSSAEPHEMLDGDLCSRVFKLLQIMDAGVINVGRYHDRFRQRLDAALVSFFQSFRKVYVGEQAIHSSKVYSRLNELLGLQDHLMVLNVVVGKIAVNLKVYAQCEELIEVTLTLFQDLAAGYMSGKLMLKLDSIKHLLRNHSKEHFPFLEEYGNFRSRTIFYSTLGRLMFMELGVNLGEAPKAFRGFMLPLATATGALLNQAKLGQLNNPASKAQLIGLMRDLRGVAVSTSSKRTYGYLFDWFYPRRSPVLLAALEAYCEDPEVTTPLLKFMAEFVHNKSQRLTFDASSPNGILLFREVSKILCAYGARILVAPSVSDAYAYRYKGIAVAVTMLSRALSGNYVNFGVFELYGDRALTDALDMSLKLCMSVPQGDVLAYRKVAKAYFSLLETLCISHLTVILQLDTMTFVQIVQSLEAGLKSLDVAISSQSAAAIDSIATFHYDAAALAAENGADPEQQDAKRAAAARQLAVHVGASPDLFPKILRTLFEIILFEDCTNQWSLSRPMLSLILMNEGLFQQLKEALGATLPDDRRARLEAGFTKLMEDVTRSLEAKNRDRFVQNLTLFRHDLRAKKS